MTSHDAAGVIHLALRSGAIVFVLLIMADGEVWWWEAGAYTRPPFQLNLSGFGHTCPCAPV